VKLGHKDIAAQGFSTGQKDIIRKALRYVEASGDVEKFTSELSRVFFSHLREACTNFMELFSTSGSTKSVGTGGGTGAAGEKISPSVGEEEDSDMASLSYLVGWIQEQMSVFVAALARQVNGSSFSSVIHFTSNCCRFNSVPQNIDPKSLNKMFTLFGIIISRDNNNC
jgi:hypothetical protein